MLTELLALPARLPVTCASVAFPRFIGCGRAGGTWKKYPPGLQHISKVRTYMYFRATSMHGYILTNEA